MFNMVGKRAKKPVRGPVMKRFFQIVAVVVVLALASLLGLKHFGHKNTDLAVKASNEVSMLEYDMEEVSPANKKRAPAVRKPQPIDPQFAQHLDKLMEEYACAPEIDCARTINAASSRTEALWLERRGYPSDSELLDLEAMPSAQIEKLAAANNLAAMAVYGDRLVKSGGGAKERGLWLLNRATLQSSIYAYYKLAEAYKDEDLSESAAYYRLAYIEGDWKAPMQLYVEHPRITLNELEIAERRALVLHHRRMERKAKEGLQMQIGVRPFEE